MSFTHALIGFGIINHVVYAQAVFPLSERRGNANLVVEWDCLYILHAGVDDLPHVARRLHITVAVLNLLH